MNQAKKPDVDFLRTTTYTPKPKGMFYGQNDGGDQHHNFHTEAHDTKPTFDQPSYHFKFDKHVKKD